MQFSNLDENQISKLVDYCKRHARSINFYSQIGDKFLDSNQIINVYLSKYISGYNSVPQFCRLSVRTDYNFNVYDNVILFASINNIGVPIFSGKLYSIDYNSDRSLNLYCSCYLYLLNSYFPTTVTSKSVSGIVTELCSQLSIPYKLPDSIYFNNVIRRKPHIYENALAIITDICLMVGHIPITDERGYIKFLRIDNINSEYVVVDSSMVISFRERAQTMLLNKIQVEYDDYIYCTYINKSSIDKYGIYSKFITIPYFSYSKHYIYSYGNSEFEWSANIQKIAIKLSFTDWKLIDNITIRMRSLASGYIKCNIVNDDNNAPGSTIYAESQLVASAEIDTKFSSVLFYFTNSVSVPAGVYWLVLDRGVTTGNIYISYSNNGSNEFALYFQSWNIHPTVKINCSVNYSYNSAILANMLLNSYSERRKSIEITTVPIPYLQIYDLVYVNSLINRGSYRVTGIVYDTSFGHIMNLVLEEF